MSFYTYTEACHASNEASKAGAMCDERLVMHRVSNGGCLDDFRKAMRVCEGEYPPETTKLDHFRGVSKLVVDVEACVKATMALRECFAANPAKFKHQYLRRIDKGLDQDTNPSPDDIRSAECVIFRWWTGMRRS